MNKKRNEYVYHLVGVITKKTKFAIKKGQQQGSDCWRLETIIDHKPAIKFIKVYSNSLENKSIWPAIARDEFLGKKYVLHCRNWTGTYYLIDWEELDNTNSETNKEDYE